MENSQLDQEQCHNGLIRHTWLVMWLLVMDHACDLGNGHAWDNLEEGNHQPEGSRKLHRDRVLRELADTACEHAVAMLLN